MSLLGLVELCALLALAGWTGLLLWPARPWSTREHLASESTRTGCTDIDVLVPARNEAASLPATLAGVLAQGSDIRVIVVDDESEDATAEIAGRTDPRVEVVSGAPTPPGWAGKTWALEQGRQHLERRFTLLLDADIHLQAGIVAAMRRKLVAEELTFVSLLARPNLESPAERLLLPAYVFFFKLLYPFALANRGASRVAAAAGGCLLIETRALHDLSVFEHIRGALIDDCALARTVKSRGRRTWIGLSNAVRSARDTARLGTLRDMVARHAYTQLNYSPLNLLGTTALMLLMFVSPIAGLLTLQGVPAGVGAAGWLLMSACYLPTLIYYQRNPAVALTLPLVALAYLAMTWTSAWRYHHGGQRASWRGRTYLRSETT